MKKLLMLTILALLAISISACGNKSDNNSTATPEPAPSASASPDASVAPTGKVVDVTINGTNFEFDVKEIKANVGDTVRVTYKNTAGNHAVQFKKFGVKITNGETKEFVVTEKGTFSFSCAIMCGAGHDKMSGKLIVS